MELIDKEFLYNCRKNRLGNGLILPKTTAKYLIDEDRKLERQGFLPKTLSYKEMNDLHDRLRIKTKNTTILIRSFISISNVKMNPINT